MRPITFVVLTYSVTEKQVKHVNEHSILSIRLKHVLNVSPCGQNRGVAKSGLPTVGTMRMSATVSEIVDCEFRHETSSSGIMGVDNTIVLGLKLI